MSARWLVVVVTGLAAASSACSRQPEVSSVGPQSVSHVPAGAVSGPHVPAGTIFTARVDEPLDTFFTAPGSTFTAAVVTPLRGPDGRILVPYGARLYGTFVSFGSPDDPRVTVAIHAIDTVDGTVPVAAAVRAAQHLDWVGPARMEPRFAHEYPFDFLEYGSSTAVLPLRREPSVGYALDQPRQVRVPRGALIQLQLTEPLLLPDSRLRQP